MMKKIILSVKKILNKLGYNLVYYRSPMETTIIPLDIKTIIDIGANTGDYAKEMRKLFPQSTIYSFEPLSSCFEALNLTMANDKNFKSYNTALGNEKGTTAINKSSFHPSSSILTMSDIHKHLYPKSKDSQQETISITTLDDILEREPLKKNVLIKMDVQGFEDKVIVGGQTIIDQASVVIIETSFVSLYQNQPLFEDIYALMMDLGFMYYGDLHRHYSKTTNRLIYEDSIFIKKADLLSTI